LEVSGQAPSQKSTGGKKNAAQTSWFGLGPSNEGDSWHKPFAKKKKNSGVRTSSPITGGSRGNVVGQGKKMTTNIEDLNVKILRVNV